MSRVIAASLALLAGALGCAGTGASSDEGAEPLVVSDPGSPWHGLAAGEAVDRFLELSIPYDLDNTHLIDDLATSYGASLVPALTTELGGIGPEASEPDLRRFLLVRVGCRWADRYREDAVVQTPSDEILDRRRALLVSLGEAVGDIDSATYRSWLRNIDEDRRCLRVIETLTDRETAREPRSRERS